MKSENETIDNSVVIIKKKNIYKTILIVFGIVILLYVFADYIIAEERNRVSIEKFKESIP